MEPTPPVEEPQALEPEDEVSTDESDDEVTIEEADDTTSPEETVTEKVEPTATKKPASSVT